MNDDMSRIEEMLTLYRSGESYGKIGKQFGISRQRVEQILRPHITPDDKMVHRRLIEMHWATNNTRTCAYEPCDRKFKARPKTKRFCSPRCLGLSRRKPFPLKKCEHCGKTMERHRFPSGMLETHAGYAKRRFCDKLCAAWNRIGHPPPPTP